MIIQYTFISCVNTCATSHMPTYAHEHSVHNAEHEDIEDIHPNGHDITCTQDIQDMDGHVPHD